ncbi:MAG: hypothetical protein LBJ57_07675 [Prevotellaceae bacterium]|jgi:hypothetical protein|nr:hypothetical protein [Prevotellaceae bacterium]
MKTEKYHRHGIPNVGTGIPKIAILCKLAHFGTPQATFANLQVVVLQFVEIKRG